MHNNRRGLTLFCRFLVGDCVFVWRNHFGDRADGYHTDATSHSTQSKNRQHTKMGRDHHRSGRRDIFRPGFRADRGLGRVTRPYSHRFYCHRAGGASFWTWRRLFLRAGAQKTSPARIPDKPFGARFCSGDFYTLKLPEGGIGSARRDRRRDLAGQRKDRTCR